MRVVCISSSINHHTVSIYDEFYSIFKQDFVFIETGKKKNKDYKGGNPRDFINLPYWKDGFSNKKNIKEAKNLCFEADVVIQFSAPDKFIIKRLIKNRLTFRVSERFCTGTRKDYLRLIKYFLRYNLLPHKNLFLLSASAYAAKDMWRSFSFRNKCYKWGYFPKIFVSNTELTYSKKLKILWAGRFVKLKHPEVCIEIAKYLINNNIDFNLTMVGDGLLLSEIKSQVSDNNLDAYFTFRGNITNKEVQLHMKEADIFVFSSDRNEGWGAVLNEAMGNGCIPIASNEAGSVPYLIKNGYNGFVYKSGENKNLMSVLDKIIELDSEQLNVLKGNAEETIFGEWSAKSAVSNLIDLINSLESQKNVIPSLTGPASEALVLSEKDFLK